MKNEEKYFENLDIETDLAGEADVESVLQLQKENLGRVLSEEEREQQGFVTFETSPETLQDIVRCEGVVVAKINSRVVGYIIPVTPERASTMAFFESYLRLLETLRYHNKPVTEYRYCILAQDCVAKEHRGGGILEKLYEQLRAHSQGKYDILLSGIDPENQRSLAAHTRKIGFWVISEPREGVAWYTVLLDLKSHKQK